MDRRRAIQSLGVGLVTGLAGCNFGGGNEDLAGSTPTRSQSGTIVDSPTTAQKAYDREFEPIFTDRVDVGVVYSPFSGDWDCLDAEPADGPYPGISDQATVNRHVDLLRGHGVDRVIFPVPPVKSREVLDTFHQGELAETIHVECRYPLAYAVDEDRDFAAGFDTLREQFTRENYTTVAGRPVLTLKTVDEFLENDDHGRWLRDNLPGGADSLATFFGWIRSELTVDGTEPYLVADLGPVRIEQAREQFLRHSEAFDYLDAVTNRYPATIWHDMPRERPGVRIKRTYAALQLLQEEAGVDVHPLVFPGFDRGVDQCNGDPLRLERSPEAFGALLAAAGRHSTSGRLRIHSFNDWPVGTQIEPGRFRETKYGLNYLATVEEFVHDGPVGFPEDRTTHHVAPGGADGNDGSPRNPLATIQEGLARALPGETVQVDEGEYLGMPRTIRHGDPDAPITIAGSKDAILRPLETTTIVQIAHDHVHLNGLTIDGLQPGRDPDAVESYAHSAIQCGPPRPLNSYLEGLQITPDAVGNARQALVSVIRSKDVEVGEFEVIGPAGLGHLIGAEDGHNGEIVYLGTASDNLGEDWHPWEEIDRTRNVYVHHIDNSGGHPHAELVDVKGGCSNVTIEYCTDAGGAAQYLLEGHDKTSETAIHLGGRECVLRWSVIENSQGQAVEIGSWGPAHPDRYEKIKGEPLPEGLKESGQENSVYGNRFLDYGGLAVRYPIIYPDDGPQYIAEDYGPDEQRHICGNELDGATHGSPTEPCSDEIPTPDQIGHLGGDSPWS